MARESSHKALSGSLVIQRADNVDGHKHAFVIRNDGSTGVYVECMRVYSVWHEPDAQDSPDAQASQPNMPGESWQVETFPMRLTLAPGDTHALLSSNDWVQETWEAFPVGWSVP